MAAVEYDATPVGGLVAGQDLHQSALAGTILPQDALDGTRRHMEADTVVGADETEALVDVP
ncbi:MAG: hypothetical protein BWY79_00983 [Actinobacteria bacterium ADurb.Bin444]|nr:MAG: hypothetical protein BWY79_00983 [Actinobacteria bacterium ADurb.Bin444]